MFLCNIKAKLGFPDGSAGEESACNVGDMGSVPVLGRSPGEGNGYPLQYTCLKNPMDCIVCGVTKSPDRTEWLPPSLFFSSVQFTRSVVSDSLRPMNHRTSASLSITNSQSLLKHMAIELVMSSSYLLLWYPLVLLPSIFPSIRVFSNESVLHIRWPKCWSFSFNISPSDEYSVLISFRVDWFDLLEVQGTLKSLLQYHSSKASIFRHSASFIVQLSQPYMTTGKTIAFTRRNFVAKVMSLLFQCTV